MSLNTAIFPPCEGLKNTRIYGFCGNFRALRAALRCFSALPAGLFSAFCFWRRFAGGNKRVGVFATRSPNRPNPIGLSAVRLEKISLDKKLGAVLEVSGIDMMNGTPIYDIKPYLSFADSYPHAVCGFAAEKFGEKATVEIPESIAYTLDAETLLQLKKILEEDPRPHYQTDPERVYGFTFKSLEIQFKAGKGVIKLLSAESKA